MVSYLVMKNNIKRLMVKKSTYVWMVVIPIVLILFGSLSARLEEKQIRVGIMGSESYIDRMTQELQNKEGISFGLAREESVNTDLIMGTYQYILKEGSENDDLQMMITELKNETKLVTLSALQRMISMLLTIYMTIATIYTMKYHQDNRDGAVGRVIMIGGTKSGYLAGCFLSSMVVTGIQLGMILLVWSMFDHNYTLSPSKSVILFLYILVLSNVYGVFVTRISKSEMMAGILGSSGAAIFSVLGGTFVAVENMPQILQIMSVCSPIRWLLAII